MSKYIHRRHNITTLRDVCLEIEDRYQLKFLEIGTDDDHAHFLVQSVPTYAFSKLVTVIKSITAHEIFRLCPHVKGQGQEYQQLHER